MKKTLASCKRFIFFHYVIWLLVPVPFICVVVVDSIQGTRISALVFMLLLISAILSFSFIVAAIISMRLYKYIVDGHEVICFESYHTYMIVDEQVVDKAWASYFHPPVLSHKLGNKQLEYSHRRLKVNGEMIMPNR